MTSEREWLTKKELRCRVDELTDMEGRYIAAILDLKAKLDRPRQLIQAILDADERGQGTPFAEAMAAAQAWIDGKAPPN